jgi:hypothetical protein
MTDPDTDTEANEQRTVEQSDQEATVPDSERAPTVDATADGGAAAEEPSTTDPAPEAGEADQGRTTGERLAWLVQVAALVILCLLALVATFRAYFSASTAIRVWISADFVSVFQTAFNLLVLIASVYGISVLVRRLS